MLVPESFMLTFVRRVQYICQLELLAAVAVYYSLPRELAGRQVIHFIDNSAALAGLAKNAAGAEDSAKIVHSFWALASALDIDVWFEYVASKANVADWPSRGDCSYLVDTLGSVAVPTVLPEVDSWGSVDDARAAAAASALPQPSLSARSRKRRV